MRRLLPGTRSGAGHCRKGCADPQQAPKNREILYQNGAAVQVEPRLGRQQQGAHAAQRTAAIPRRRETPVSDVSNILTRLDRTAE